MNEPSKTPGTTVNNNLDSRSSDAHSSLQARQAQYRRKSIVIPRDLQAHTNAKNARTALQDMNNNARHFIRRSTPLHA